MSDKFIYTKNDNKTINTEDDIITDELLMAKLSISPDYIRIFLVHVLPLEFIPAQNIDIIANDSNIIAKMFDFPFSKHTKNISAGVAVMEFEKIIQYITEARINTFSHRSDLFSMTEFCIYVDRPGLSNMVAKKYNHN